VNLIRVSEMQYDYFEKKKPVTIIAQIKISIQFSYLLYLILTAEGFENRVLRRIFGPKREED
jgi:hypothetical protein